ncbi:tetratricopeptide (TPR) repeat protein [Neobacillus niacini]|uniref:tetratricopeptide repeat protein n=1 Tax=Neobacillus niacini TaxID=86668 RepID=UPI0028673CF4|nr:tetratricopeptide repeat protein [Neobacillus niacini]MDR7079526.1 tetratricopeptide (TPR) repeat protein [Neobacillus niacini]
MKKILTGITILFVLAGCNPKASTNEKSEKIEAVKTYYDLVIDGDFEKAYSMLSEKSKQIVKKEDFVLWQTLLDEKEELMSADVKATENENVFTVDVTVKDFYDDKVLNATSEISVVTENDQVKMNREELNTNVAIGDTYSTIGLMYADGKGKPSNLELAEENLKQALEYDSENSNSYLNLGYVYYKKKQYDKSLTEYNQALDLIDKKDTEVISLILSNMGGSYLEMGDTQKAKEYFTQALEVNPKNELAKNGLDTLKSN